VTWALLADAAEATRFGGKAAGLARAIRAGLPVPSGIAVAWPAVEAVGAGDPAAEAELRSLAPLREAGDGLAVRSSAVGEDGGRTSFAGQHETLLNVTADGIVDAVREVWRSGRSDAARAYRRRLGVEGPARMGVVVQRLVRADVAGILFTRNPIDGSDELLIESSWGLGEVVVGGRVIPDRYRLTSSGTVLEATAGRKDVALRATPGGGRAEVAVHGGAVDALSLHEAHLAELHGLALRCEAAFGPGQDIEWALADGAIHLLQVRPLTTVEVVRR
jgi:pyruvate,water dikinase